MQVLSGSVDANLAIRIEETLAILLEAESKGISRILYNFLQRTQRGNSEASARVTFLAG